MEQRESAARQALRKKWARKRAVCTAVFLALAAALGAAAFVILPQMNGEAADNAPQTEKRIATATLGTIEKTVFGLGEVQPASQPAYTLGPDGTLAAYTVEVGDSVKAGDIVARLENDELDADIEQLEYDLQTAQQEVRATQTHTQYVYKELYDEDGDLRYDVNTWEPLLGQFSNEITIRAPADGLIKAIYIEKGDDALAVYRQYGAVMMISTDGKMKVELSGLSGEALELGQTVVVKGGNVETTGTVVSLIRRGTEATVEVGSDEYDMDIPVTVYAQDGKTIGEGTLEINKPMAISAYGGTIKGLLVKVGDRCSRYDALARIEWDEIPLYLDNASVLRDYDKVLVSLETAYEKRDALTVTAPCDGVVATLDADKGDDVTDGTKLMSIVEDGAGSDAHTGCGRTGHSLRSAGAGGAALRRCAGRRGIERHGAEDCAAGRHQRQRDDLRRDRGHPRRRCAR